ncbi:hypothetical protein LPJ70_001461 [Coemansia sp. RSA 2708]|nr:hypothetical protein LPJ70_001461 [Coemansia sp. RSA 2708]
MIIHSVFIAVPVAIMPVTARDDSSILPRYETAVRNPGSLIMRSDTLPPAYDTVRADDPGPEPGEDIDGFPAALHRSRSQFYLASPDHSPVLRAADSDAQPAPNHNNSRPTFEISPPTFNISPQTLNSSPQTLSISQQTLNNTPSDEAQASAQSAASCNADSVSTLASPAAPPPEQPPEKSARASEHCLAVASHPASLHERLANSRITDKVRSIFHARSSSSHSRHHRRNRSSCSSAGLQPPPEIRRRPSSVTRSMTPPPARIHEPIGVHEPIGAHVSAPRRSSAAPSSGYSLHSPSQPVEGEARFAGGLDHQRNMHAPRPPPTAMLQSPGSPHRNPTPIASPLITH